MPKSPGCSVKRRARRGRLCTAREDAYAPISHGFTRTNPIERVRGVFPAATHRILEEGVARTTDYQDAAYAALYLDRLVPNHPVAIQESYYRTYLNTRGLEAFGIRDGAADPSDFPKGSIVRDASGRATGAVEGAAAAR